MLDLIKLSYIAGSSNGRTTDSESVYLRSNRGPAAENTTILNLKCYNTFMKETLLHSVQNVLKKGYSVADLHMHSTFSRDVRHGMTPEEAVIFAEKSKLQAIAITDHDWFRSSESAFNYAQKQGLKVMVVPGMEVTTREGHLIGLFLSHPIPRKMGIIDTIRNIHRQSGLAIAPHPFFTAIGTSLNLETIQKIIQCEDPEIYLDGFEIHNKGVEDTSTFKKGYKDTNIDAQVFYKKNSQKLGAPIGSSDGHRMTAGRGLSAFKGDLKEAIREKTTTVVFVDDNYQDQLILNAVELFGKERVMGNFNSEEFRKRLAPTILMQ